MSKETEKGRPNRKGLEEIVNEKSSPCHPQREEGEEVSMEKRKVNTKNEKKNSTENAKNHLNPAHNSGHVSCATNGGPITRTCPDTEVGGRQENAQNPPPTQPKKNEPGTRRAGKPLPENSENVKM